MQHFRNIRFRSELGLDVADHTEMSTRNRSWFYNETELFEALVATSHLYLIKNLNFRPCSVMPAST